MIGLTSATNFMHGRQQRIAVTVRMGVCKAREVGRKN
jgi:hypothetical protein